MEAAARAYLSLGEHGPRDDGLGQLYDGKPKLPTVEN